MRYFAPGDRTKAKVTALHAKERNVMTSVGVVLVLALLFTSFSLFADKLSNGLKGVSPDCPQWILDNQAAIEVRYLDFEGKIRQGIIIADFRLAEDIQKVFQVALESRFVIRQVRPVNEFGWDDFVSMTEDNTSAFNYRTVPFSKSLSNHAYGCAIDINPRENPYYNDGKIFPEGAGYDIKAPGTLAADHPVVIEFKKRGWRWGGDWKSKDYQHFDKRLLREKADGNKRYYSWK